MTRIYIDGDINELLYTCKRNKFVYAFLAIFFGSFGLQHFYVSRTFLGVMSILFFWTGIPTIVGIFQGIAALFKPSDEHLRAWFW